MALNTSLIDMSNWMQAKDWQSAALTTQRLLEAGVQKQRQDQEMALRLRQLMVQEQQQTALNQIRLEQLNQKERQLRDLTKLHEYSKNPDAGVPEFEDPSSYSKLSAVDLSRARGDVGRQNIADLTDFNKRLTKISPTDRATIRSMQKADRPEDEQWGFLEEAETRQRTRLADEKRTPTLQSKLWDEADAAEQAGDLDRVTSLRNQAKGLGREREAVERMTIPDKEHLKTMRSRLDAINRDLEFVSKERKTALREERQRVEDDIEAIIDNYEKPTGTTPAVPSGAQPKAQFRYEPGKGLVPLTP